MRTKLIPIVLTLVVLPTAILGLMASHALKARELVLADQVATNAGKAVQAVIAEVGRKLDADLDRISLSMSDRLAQGGKYEDIHATAEKLRASMSIVGRVYLFMNPWGFLYPQSGDDQTDRSVLRPGWDYIPKPGRQLGKASDIPSALNATDDLSNRLIAELRKAALEFGPERSSLRICLDDMLFCFKLLPNRTGLFAGYQVDLSAARELVSELAAGVPGHGIVLTVANLEDGAGAGVIVSDSLTPAEVSNSKLIWADAMKASAIENTYVDATLARGYPLSPLKSVLIEAVPADSGSMRWSETFRAQLYGWGITLLALGICAGVVLVMRESALEIRHARVRSDFVIGVSHDLRTPIASMKMLAESLYLDRVPDRNKQKAFLSTIARECERLNQLVERVLFFVRMDQNALAYRLNDVNVSQTVSCAIEGFKARCEECNIELAIQGELPLIKADESAITQVVLNLLDNAAKYGKESSKFEDQSSKIKVSSFKFQVSKQGVEAGDTGLGEIQVRVEKVLRRKRWRIRMDEWIRISVTDYGPGINPREMKKIFRRFYRSPSAADNNLSGVGLGLALCRHIMHAHGGWIEADSVPGKGSMFSAFLPV
ncbi:MAG: HAMP domain-containing histidine kinase [Lentisphaerae bacterium]|nr:HAMP domain-containing histidine kinase [Lentisphaerota bacterium]